MNKKLKVTARQICIFSMLGTIMFLSKLVLEFLPNIHMLGMLTMVYTLVYRKKALIPIYIYVFLNGLYAGFSLWWVPYLYIFSVLWLVTMLLPKKMPLRAQMTVYPVVCALHGLLFGVLYSPFQALIMRLTVKQTLAWIAAGFFPFDVIHAIGNFLFGMLIVPLVKLLTLLESKTAIKN